MRILIVNLHLDIGGVETLLVRLIPQLHRRGMKVTLLLLRRRVDPEFAKALEPFCDIRFVADAAPFTRAGIRRVLGDAPDIAFFTISQAFVTGSWLLSRAGYRTKTVLGAYQTEIFCTPAKPWQYHRTIVHDAIRKSIPARSIIFGNTAGRDFHAKRLHVDLAEAPIIRLFVDVEKYTFVERAGLPRRKIVSIGRISPYKTYNFTMLPIMKSLCAAGRDVEWHVYGDGEEFGKLRETVAAMGLEGSVYLHGPLQYSKFQQVLDDAFLFVGSGTSLIEAAACGVPALTTIEYAEKADSYGFICEVEGYNLIEPGLDKRVYGLEEKIVEALDATPAAYADLRARCLRKALSYSGESVVDEYVAVFREAAQSGRQVPISSGQALVYGASAATNVVLRKLGLSS